MVRGGRAQEPALAVIGTECRNALDCMGDCCRTGGAGTSWVFSRLISDRGWGRGMDFEVGGNRCRG